ncbi:uncharacterized protein LOC108906220 [Anoplophora glabripennis]|uniref:uncharacterized protein LOC108906220 n=1 Tax=Anoplophora glabripennis TaxID=217634 RepID=UPI0008755F4D|nr:uncharacterized protein LOC108906220 [Anoplophora glabripennis]
MMEQWTPVLLDNGKHAINGCNIVLQHTETNEIGYIENTIENREMFGVIEPEEIGHFNVAETSEDGVSKEICKIEWGDETKLLLDLNYEYLPQVGPMKKFKSKKKMWEQISEDIQNKLKLIRTALQCETRFKTIKRRKNCFETNNRQSGNNPINIPYEDEFNKIKSIDDSIEPEILVDVTHKVVNTKEPLSRNEISTFKKETMEKSKAVESGSKRKSDKITETLINIHHEKEAARERRHREKMEMLEKLIKKQKTCNCDK